MSNKAYLLLGSNQGDRAGWLERAVAEIGEHIGPVVNRSSIYETAAWGLKDQPDFLNLVTEVETPLSPLALLAAVQQIEAAAERQRMVKWGPRTLDVDILLYNNEVIDTPELKVPHPYLPERRFTLAPLSEIAGGLVHPVLHRTIDRLLLECRDPARAVIFRGR